jgi:hypothetical protein
MATLPSSAKTFDQSCNDLATAGGINNSTGNAFISLVSETGNTFASRLGSASGFMRTDGLPFANNLATGPIYTAVQLDQFGKRRSFGYGVLTGTKADLSAGLTCSDWTTNNGQYTMGDVWAGAGKWIENNSYPCSSPYFYYCAMKTITTSVSIVPGVGNRIYLSESTLTPGGGRSAADAACSATKPNGVTGSVKALLATTTQAPSAVLKSATNYYRPDGLFVATGADLAAGNTLTSGIWQTASGTYVSDTIWSSTKLPNEIPTASTCTDWTSTSGNGGVGNANTSQQQFWFSVATDSCAAAHRVICVEQ